MLTPHRLGRTDLHPTALSMGGAWIGSRSDSDREAVEAVHRALELGINYFDTAPSYLHGEAERRMGLALKDLPRERYILSTKFGSRPGMRNDFSAEGVRRSLEMSLDTLGVECGEGGVGMARPGNALVRPRHETGLGDIDRERVEIAERLLTVRPASPRETRACHHRSAPADRARALRPDSPPAESARP